MIRVISGFGFGTLPGRKVEEPCGDGGRLEFDTLGIIGEWGGARRRCFAAGFFRHGSGARKS